MKSEKKASEWSKVEDAELAAVRGVCLDIDETLSTRGKLTSEAYRALWALKEAGFWVVPITGRPAGWCDHFARFWPVDAVVGENGAFTFTMEGNTRRRLDTPGAIQDSNERKLKLAALAAAVGERFPHAVWASDQAYREHDLAIDICEDVPAWPSSDVEALLKLCHGLGAHAKLSSIHVNAWFGEYDKRKGFDAYLAHQSRAPRVKHWLFIGDSPNDEPLFASFEHSVGVANVGQYLDRMQSPPRWITKRESGGGFAEMAERLIRAHQGKST